MGEPIFICVEPVDPMGTLKEMPDLQSLITEQWESAVIKRDSSGHNIMEWSVDIGGYEDGYYLVCTLMKHALAVQSNNFKRMVEVVLWYYSLDHEYPLFVYNANTWTTPKRVSDKTTVEEIITWFQA